MIVSENLRRQVQQSGDKHLEPLSGCGHAPHADDLASGPFADSLCMQPTANLDELWKRVAKYTQLEKLREFRNQARAKAVGEKGM